MKLRVIKITVTVKDILLMYSYFKEGLVFWAFLPTQAWYGETTITYI